MSPSAPAPDALIRALGVSLPIVQAPMAGGPTTPEMVAAVAEAGALGSYAAAYSPPEQIRAAVAAIRTGTSRPFAVNLFAPRPLPQAPDPTRVRAALAPLCAELAIPVPSLPAALPFSFDEQVQVLMEERVAVVSFTFGLLPPATMSALEAQGAFLIGTATSVDEALALEAAGVKAIVAQGSEAGGHRGAFLGAPPGGLLGTITLVPQVVDAVRLPVIAAGGIMDGRGIAAARALGAAASQLGTAFLACRESGWPPAVRALLLASRGDETAVTAAVTGRHGRLLKNHLVDALGAVEPLPFEWQGALVMALRKAALSSGRPDLLPLFAGQGLGQLRPDIGAGELVRALAAEADAAC